MDCITLLSDFGLQDASVAYAKGMMRQYTPQIPIIDITHSIAPFHLQQAAYILAAAYQSFPAKTCHVILFDVFYDKESTLLLCEKNGQYFLAPDNGILSLAFDASIDKVWGGCKMNADNGFKAWLQQVGTLLALLEKDSPEKLTLAPCELKNAPTHWLPRIEGNTVECHVIHIDRFENVVLNITREQFEKIGRNRNFKIQFMRNEFISAISKHYTEVKQGEKLCRFNSAGYLEIAINRGQAASLFGLKLRQDQHLIYNTIKIFFE